MRDNDARNEQAFKVRAMEGRAYSYLESGVGDRGCADRVEKGTVVLGVLDMNQDVMSDLVL